MLWHFPRKLPMDKTIHSRDYAVFLALLKRIRIEAKIPQTELASRMGETQVFVSKCERGDRRLDIIETIRWCNALGLDLSELASRLAETSLGSKAKSHLVK